MAVELRAADLLVMDAVEKADRGAMTDADAAMVKLYCSEMLDRAADCTVQIYGGMGLMEELPVQHLSRDARLERIWDGGREARGGPRRGGGRSRPDRAELLRVHQLS